MDPSLLYLIEDIENFTKDTFARAEDALGSEAVSGLVQQKQEILDLTARLKEKDA